MNTFSDQNEVAAYARERLTSQLGRARSLADEVDDSILMQPRPDGGWSPAAILDHLAVMNRLYLAKLERAVLLAEPSPRRDWRPTMQGRLLRWSVTTRMKLKTPSLFKPADPISDSQALSRFLRSQEELLRLLDRSDAVHWRSVRVSSPAADFVRFNLGDVFVVLADHGERHLTQLEAALAN